MTKEKTPSDLVQKQKLTYGEFVRAKVAAGSRKATTQEKIYASTLWQRRQARAKAIRKTFKVVSG
ncbi:hypothetical protein V6R85_02425 [Agrobacterium sp. CCNWLW32]|uniref:hypothetical protein n=1 Tax=Agrobacterium sp. CCNWLW32 TaxID=3122072 RepID=UPI00301029BE